MFLIGTSPWLAMFSHRTKPVVRNVACNSSVSLYTDDVNHGKCTTCSSAQSKST